MYQEQKNFVSVIIPVYNDAKRLIECLNLLSKQTYPQELYEVIVVDNNSEEDIDAIAAKFSCVMTTETRKGSYAARNKGLAIAKGEVIAFTDSDCIPAEDWIAKGVEQLKQNPECKYAAGKIELFYAKPHQPSVIEIYDSLNFLRQEFYVKELNFGATANLFTYKEVFDRVGLFNADLKSSGDREWGQRVHQFGYAQLYAEDVYVAHPARNKLKELQTKVARITEGLSSLYCQKPRLSSFWRQVYLDFKPPRKEIIALLKNEQLNSFSLKTKYIMLFMFLRWVGALTKIRIFNEMRSNQK